jgi:hypothetical protein
MKVQQLLELKVCETNRSLQELTAVFNDSYQSQLLYDENYELLGFRTTDKSTIQYIIYKSEFDGRININSVDILEINF